MIEQEIARRLGLSPPDAFPERRPSNNDFGANLGLTPTILIADWMRATLDGKPFASEKWYVESSGRIVKTPL